MPDTQLRHHLADSHRKRSTDDGLIFLTASAPSILHDQVTPAQGESTFQKLNRGTSESRPRHKEADK